MKLLSRLTARETISEQRMSWDEYLAWVQSVYGGKPWTSYGTSQEAVATDFETNVASILKRNGPVAALMAFRQDLFSQVRWTYQQLRAGQPGDLWSNPSLDILNDDPVLNKWLIGDVDLAGNFYGIVENAAFSDNRRVTRLRPDWVQLVSDLPLQDVRARVRGFVYFEDGYHGQPPDKGQFFPASEVIHWYDRPDPAARWRGMSWLTPIAREVAADNAATTHKQKFFENGAPQPLNAKILTPMGWATMRNMRVGDYVIGSDGKGHEVLAVYPQGERDIYRVTFSDGATVECTEDHLWEVASAYDRKLGTSRTMTLRQIADGGFRYQSGPAKWSVALPEPVQYVAAGSPLPLDPYLLGVLLGDGCLGHPNVSLSAHVDDADETERLIRPMLPADVQVKRRTRGGCVEFSFPRVNGTDRTNTLSEIVRDLGLWGTTSYTKFIPEQYLRSDVLERVAVLQGLIDTDGHVEKRQPNTVRLTTASPQLAADMVDLVGGLGGVAKIRPNKGRRTLTVTVSKLPEWINPCRLERKAAHYQPPSVRSGRYRYMVSAEFVRVDQAQCISVDVADSLYVTDNFVLTHNTPNLVFKFDERTSPAMVREFKDMIQAENTGTHNAYKNLYMGGGADVTVVGADMRQLEFAVTQGKGESRLASAARVPAVLVGFSEGLQAATYSNYASARRMAADGLLHPLWVSAAGALGRVVRPPSDSRLWYDARDIPFLREDAKDDAEIKGREAQTIRTLVDAGYKPESVVAAVTSGDWSRLEHTDLFSVQLQPPGAQEPVAPRSLAVETDERGWPLRLVEER